MEGFSIAIDKLLLFRASNRQWDDRRNDVFFFVDLFFLISRIPLAYDNARSLLPLIRSLNFGAEPEQLNFWCTHETEDGRTKLNDTCVQRAAFRTSTEVLSKSHKIRCSRWRRQRRIENVRCASLIILKIIPKSINTWTLNGKSSFWCRSGSTPMVIYAVTKLSFFLFRSKQQQIQKILNKWNGSSDTIITRICLFVSSAITIIMTVALPSFFSFGFEISARFRVYFVICHLHSLCVFILYISLGVASVRGVDFPSILETLPYMVWVTAASCVCVCVCFSMCTTTV